jgi:hypothetical protein
MACVFLATTRDASCEALSQMPDNAARWHAIVNQFLQMWDTDVASLPSRHRT